MDSAGNGKSVSRNAGERLVAATFNLCLSGAVVYLLFFNLEPGAPARQWMNGTYDRWTWGRQLAAMDQGFIDDAAGGNVELHFSGFDPDVPDQGVSMCRFYFRGNYALYPNQALVGRGNQIINGATDIASTDVVPDDRWLMQRNVRSVQQLTRTQDDHIHGETRPIP